MREFTDIYVYVSEISIFHLLLFKYTEIGDCREVATAT